MNNNILKLQGFLKHDDFASKYVNNFKIPMLEDIIRTNEYKNKKDNNSLKKIAID